MTLEEAKEILQSDDVLIEISKLKEAKKIATRAIDKQIELKNYLNKRGWEVLDVQLYGNNVDYISYIEDLDRFVLTDLL